MKKLSITLLSIFMVLSILAGCTTPTPAPTAAPEPVQQTEPETKPTEAPAPAEPATPAEPIEITMWHTLAEHHQASLDKIIEDFNASQNEVKMTAIAQPYQDFWAKVMQAVRNGTGPDMVGAFPTEAANYLADDLLVDFAPFVHDPEIGIPDFKESLSGELYGEITQWDPDKIYLFPAISTSEVLFYNKTMFDELGLEPPKTWIDVENYSKVIREKKGIPGFGTDSAIDTWQGLLKQAGGEYIDPVTKTVMFNSEIGLKQLTWFADNVKAGNFRLVGEDYYFSNPFGSEAVGSYIGSSAGVQYVMDAVGGKFEVGCVPIPQEGTVPYISSWGTGYMAFKSTEEKAQAVYKFLRFFIEPERLAGWAIAFGAIPAYKEARELPVYQEYLKTNIAAKALYEQIDRISFLSSIPGSAAVRTHIDKMIQEAAMGVLEPQAALDAAEAACNADLQQ